MVEFEQARRLSDSEKIVAGLHRLQDEPGRGSAIGPPLLLLRLLGLNKSLLLGELVWRTVMGFRGTDLWLWWSSDGQKWDPESEGKQPLRESGGEISVL